MAGRSALLAPFQVRNFRLQFPADMATSWGIEMEVLILGWYILAETGSVFLLTLYGSLQYTGTLVAPVVGMAGDQFGHRNVLCAMRASYAVLAAVIGVMAFTNTATSESRSGQLPGWDQLPSGFFVRTSAG